MSANVAEDILLLGRLWLSVRAMAKPLNQRPAVELDLLRERCQLNPQFAHSVTLRKSRVQSQRFLKLELGRPPRTDGGVHRRRM